MGRDERLQRKPSLQAESKLQLACAPMFWCLGVVCGGMQRLPLNKQPPFWQNHQCLTPVVFPVSSRGCAADQRKLEDMIGAAMEKAEVKQ